MTSALGTSWLDASQLIETFGLLGIMVIVFAECGLLVGFFLPGDTLLFSAGVLVQRGHVPPAAVAGHRCSSAWPRSSATRSATRSAGAVAPRCSSGPTHGSSGPSTSSARATFFEKYGPPAIVLGRFVPVVRTVITVMAGAGRMDYRTYTLYTVLGGVLWATSVTLLGYFLGNIDFIANNIELLLLAGVAVSVVPIALRHRGELTTFGTGMASAAKRLSRRCTALAGDLGDRQVRARRAGRAGPGRSRRSGPTGSRRPRPRSTPPA